MRAVVPAAGDGTRLRPLTEDKPKGLVEVAGKPLLTHVFDALQTLERVTSLEEIIVVVGYRSDQIRSFYGDSFEGTPLRYVTQERRRGLAHALLQAEPHISDDFVSLNGDNVIRANLADVVVRHRESDADVTTLVERVSRERATKGAAFELDDGDVTGIVEKPAEPPSRLVPRGFYAFSTRIFPACRSIPPSETGEFELTDAIDLLLNTGRKLETVEMQGWCHNVNAPDDRTTVRQKLSNQP